MFVVSLPPSTGNVAYPRFVHIDEPKRFRIMLRLFIVSFATRCIRLATSWILHALSLSSFSRGMNSFPLMLFFPYPLAYFYYDVIPLLLIGALFPTTKIGAL